MPLVDDTGLALRPLKLGLIPIDLDGHFSW